MKKLSSRFTHRQSFEEAAKDVAAVVNSPKPKVEAAAICCVDTPIDYIDDERSLRLKWVWKQQSVAPSPKWRRRLISMLTSQSTTAMMMRLQLRLWK